MKIFFILLILMSSTALINAFLGRPHPETKKFGKVNDDAGARTTRENQNFQAYHTAKPNERDPASLAKSVSKIRAKQRQ